MSIAPLVGEELADAIEYVEPAHPAEAPNRPLRHHGEVQGKDQILVVVLPNSEYKRPSGIVIADTKMNQDRPTCGIVIQTSPIMSIDKDSGNELYPKVKPGAFVRMAFNALDTWIEPDGVEVGQADARHVRYVYKPARDISSTPEKEVSDAIGNYFDFISNQSVRESRPAKAIIH